MKTWEEIVFDWRSLEKDNFTDQIKIANIQKIAKSRLIKEVERLMKRGKKDKALDMLRRAEEAGGTGSLAAREIKGLTDKLLGFGQHGKVEEAFFGGKMVPTKRMRRGYGINIGRFEEEGRNSARMQSLVKNDPELAQLVQVPEYLAAEGYKGVPSLVGQGKASIYQELKPLKEKIKKRGYKSLTRNEKGRLKQLERASKAKNVGAGQSIPMGRIDMNADRNLTGESIMNQRLKAAKAKQILEDRYDMALTDLNPGADNENMAVAAGGKPYLMDFGIVHKKGWESMYPKEAIDDMYEQLGPAAKRYREKARNMSVEDIAALDGAASSYAPISRPKPTSSPRAKPTSSPRAKPTSSPRSAPSSAPTRRKSKQVSRSGGGGGGNFSRTTKGTSDGVSPLMYGAAAGGLGLSAYAAKKGYDRSKKRKQQAKAAAFVDELSTILKSGR